MGFNRLIFCLNDRIHDISHNPEGWWRSCMMAFAHKGIEPARFAHDSIAVWEQHADVTGVIMVGKNHVSIIGSSYSDHATEEDQLRILKDILDQKGYRVVKKSNRKRTSKKRSSSKRAG